MLDLGCCLILVHLAELLSDHRDILQTTRLQSILPHTTLRYKPSSPPPLVPSEELLLANKKHRKYTRR